MTGLGNLTQENRLSVGALALLMGASPLVTAAERKVASETRDAITRSVQTAMADVLRELDDVAQEESDEPASRKGHACFPELIHCWERLERRPFGLSGATACLA